MNLPPSSLSIAVLLPLLLTACRPAADTSNAAPPLPAAVETTVLERGRAITAQAFGLLSTNLVQALAAGGITNALPYCSEKAYPLTALVAATNEVKIRRVTHRPRNPTNAATGIEWDLLRKYQLALGRGETLAPTVRAGTNGQVTFYSPIVITNPLCLQCHGVPRDGPRPSTQALLRKLYPLDEATGFKLGDLRGLWRVDFAR
ncbi:MAG: DUF3365 domain-containing protein [Verrucomicrobia bacterium]|nr:DUF3365 domain-containing protein [Verrucomicrobiota bacterium]